MTSTVIAVEAALDLAAGTDPRAAGGEVTVALCGHWEHDGPCRWPHNSRIETGVSPARLRTVVVFPESERDEVERRIEQALRTDSRWTVVAYATGPIHDDEHDLARRLAQVLGDPAEPSDSQ